MPRTTTRQEVRSLLTRVIREDGTRLGRGDERRRETMFFFDGATTTTTTEDDDDAVVFVAPPDNVLGRDECEELKNETIPRFAEEVLRSKVVDVEWLRRTVLRRGTADWKPLRPYWIAKDGGDECGAEE